MKTMKMYQVDAFTDELFKGNPAAVCPLDRWISATLMQQIATENNLAETAFFVRNQDESRIRWFTPVVEVDLCGHATLASAHVIFNYIEPEAITLVFDSRSGQLTVTRQEDRIVLDFPVDRFQPVRAPDLLRAAFSEQPDEVYQGKTDYMLVYHSEDAIRMMQPDFQKINASTDRGVIITAPGRDVDFISRFFAPRAGINEDPVTGSAHTTLTPYWAQKLGKDMLRARQVSARGGDLECRMSGDRVLISGKAVTYLVGEISAHLF